MFPAAGPVSPAGLDFRGIRSIVTEPFIHFATGGWESPAAPGGRRFDAGPQPLESKMDHRGIL
jgi:hypothetical protein